MKRDHYLLQFSTWHSKWIYETLGEKMLLKLHSDTDVHFQKKNAASSQWEILVIHLIQ